MLKYTALLFNTIALLLCKFLFLGDVKITQNIPSSAKPDSEFMVEITINKGSMGGFAKLQQFIPQGLTVTPVEMKGGDFKFVDQQVKIIWMSLPTDTEFKISYKVKVAGGVGGDKKFGGKFSYVVDNVKQEVEVPESIVKISSGAAEQPVATETPKEAPKSETPPAATETKTETPPVATETKTETPPTKTETPPAATETKAETPAATETKTETKAAVTSDAAGVSCTRNVPSSVNSTDFVVEIKVNKGNISGFAKLLETLPAGFTAAGMELSGASFSFMDQKAKFVWVSMPTQPEFTISYKVTVPSGTAGNINIDGVFSYIENDETKKYTIAPSTIAIGETGAVTTNIKTPDNTSNTNTNTNTSAANTNATNNTGSETASNQTNTNTAEKTVTSTPTPQSNVTYRVQIAALHNAVSASSLAQRYNINDNVITEMMDGYTKYTVGSHNLYKSARDARENIRNKGVTGPFVTAYNSGKRITVQEALMLTSQQWYK